VNAEGPPDGVYTLTTGGTAVILNASGYAVTPGVLTGVQTLRVYARRGPPEAGVPTLDAVAQEIGGTSTTIFSGRSVAVAGVYEGTWTPSNPALPVEFVCTGTPNGGNPNTRTPVQFDSIEWVRNFEPDAEFLGSSLKTWQSTEWIDGTLHYWNGSIWVPAPAYRWDGGGWAGVADTEGTLPPPRS